MRFNFLKRKLQQTTNHEGARAYTITPEAELYAAVVTSSLSDGFYEGSGERVARIRELIGRVDAPLLQNLPYTLAQVCICAAYRWYWP